MPAANKKSAKKVVDADTAGGQANGKSQDVTTNWPLMTPCGYKDDLALQHVYTDQILTIPQFWTSTLCKKYVNFLSSLHLVTTPSKPKRGEAVRVNDRLQLQDAAFAEMLWSQTPLKDLVLEAGLDDQDNSEQKLSRWRDLWGGEPLGLNPNIRIYRYGAGQYFDQHYDDSNNLLFPSNPPTPAKTTWTLLLYLTSAADGCKGGATVFYPEPSKKGKNQPEPDPVVCELDTGMALLHRHGDKCMLHEGKEVTEGFKWVIRSDLCVKR